MKNINFIVERNPNIYINNKEKENITFKNYIERYLIKQLTTYEGRMKAIKKIYRYHKLVPIYVSSSLCFIPLNNSKDYELIYINVYQIKSIIKLNTKTLIKFYDNSEIIINKLYNTIYNNYHRALIIKS